jgi:hypothetical protein
MQIYGADSLSFAKILAAWEINSLQDFLIWAACYNSGLCSPSFGYGSGHWLVPFTRAKPCCWKIWLFSNNSRS